MPSRIEELIAAWRKFADTDYTKGMKLGDSRKQAQYELMMAGQSLAYATAAQNLERAYREEVVPMVQTLRDALAWVPPCSGTDAAIKDILHRFDAPAGTDPKPTAEEKERYCPKHSPKGIVCDCDLAAEEPQT